MLLVLSSLAAWGATLEEDVSRGWYLWETGQDAEAQALASALVQQAPEALPAIELYAAMQVAEARGASVEAEYRERFSRDPQDPLGRVSLAFAMTYRHAAPGGWCDDVRDLVSSVLEGDGHAWATIAEREAEHRCEDGSTDHADAELGRLSKDPESPAWADGVLARADAGYIRTELADELERVWGVAPDKLYRAPGLWEDRTSGPSKRRARRDARRALEFAIESPRPVWVWAALKAYRALGWADEVALAEAALTRLDPEAGLDLGRDRHAITDPPAYAEIDACFDDESESAVRACSAAIEDPGSGSIGAYLHYRRFLAMRAFGDRDAALDEAIAAWQADPSLRSYARIVVVASLDVEPLPPESEAAAADAIATLLDYDPEVDQAGSTVARRWARDLALSARVQHRAGNSSAAADQFLKSLAYDPSAARRLELGIALADAKQSAPAVLHLTRGLVEAMDAPDLVRLARRKLDRLASDWERRDANQVLQEAIGGQGRPSPLLGEVLEPGSWPWPADAGPAPTVRVVVLWGELHEVAATRYAALRTVATLAAQNEDVAGYSVDVGIRRADLPEGIDLRHASAGPLVVQSLQLVTVPSVLVLDAEYRLRSVLSPFDADADADAALLDAVEAVRAE
ncbi:MAG: hypothetical protein AAF602_19030 [Myxococcota bacterium]